MQEKEDGTIRHISFYSGIIQTMGYDPQYALLEIRLVGDGKVRQYSDVPEETWYHLRESYHPDTYYHRHICGCYKEYVVLEGSA
ncbi:KTSC domain-containing protein [uncultured Acetatifactor sp.]|uniref:KTSC domain-containing protein n=1 Tax=uncultured Acetatifactor sp. TaxID=1671927 RepID=UPI002ED255A6